MKKSETPTAETIHRFDLCIEKGENYTEETPTEEMQKLSSCCRKAMKACESEICQEDAMHYGHDCPMVCSECGVPCDSVQPTPTLPMNTPEEILAKVRELRKRQMNGWGRSYRNKTEGEAEMVIIFPEIVSLLEWQEARIVALEEAVRQAHDGDLTYIDEALIDPPFPLTA